MLHYAILIDNQSQVDDFVEQIIGNKQVNHLGVSSQSTRKEKALKTSKQDSVHINLDCRVKGFEALAGKTPALFSTTQLEHFLYEETYHDIKILTVGEKQSLKSMSSGEQKKMLLSYLLHKQPDFMVLVNPYDNLDTESQQNLKNKLQCLAQKIPLVQLVNRVDDILPFSTTFFTLDKHHLKAYPSPESFWKMHGTAQVHFENQIPKALVQRVLKVNELVRFEKVSVTFGEKQVLYEIDWIIKKGEFWQLKGPNGSGKSTLIKMITGDSHKGYGQNLTLFGKKKGSGESVWDIKQHIGYFTPSMIDDFKGYHSLEKMLISGLHDSIGLYTYPADSEKRLAIEWLDLLGLSDKKEFLFRQLTTGEKRLVMTARAMIKHPSLLILDEPTIGLDDKNANLFVALINKIATNTDTAIIFVSHRNEGGLNPKLTYNLESLNKGSIGKIA